MERITAPSDACRPSEAAPLAWEARQGDSLKDDDSYLRTDTARFAANTRALATANLDVDLGDADWLAQTDASAGDAEVHRHLVVVEGRLQVGVELDLAPLLVLPAS